MKSTSSQLSPRALLNQLLVGNGKQANKVQKRKDFDIAAEQLKKQQLKRSEATTATNNEEARDPLLPEQELTRSNLNPDQSSLTELAFMPQAYDKAATVSPIGKFQALFSAHPELAPPSHVSSINESSLREGAAYTVHIPTVEANVIAGALLNMVDTGAEFIAKQELETNAVGTELTRTGAEATSEMMEVSSSQIKTTYDSSQLAADETASEAMSNIGSVGTNALAMGAQAFTPSGYAASTAENLGRESEIMNPLLGRNKFNADIKANEELKTMDIGGSDNKILEADVNNANSLLKPANMDMDASKLSEASKAALHRSVEAKAGNSSSQYNKAMDDIKADFKEVMQNKKSSKAALKSYTQQGRELHQIANSPVEFTNEKMKDFLSGSCGHNGKDTMWEHQDASGAKVGYFLHLQESAPGAADKNFVLYKATFDLGTNKYGALETVDISSCGANNTVKSTLNFNQKVAVEHGDLAKVKLYTTVMKNSVSSVRATLEAPFIKKALDSVMPPEPKNLNLPADKVPGFLADPDKFAVYQETFNTLKAKAVSSIPEGQPTPPIVITYSQVKAYIEDRIQNHLADEIAVAPEGGTNRGEYDVALSELHTFRSNPEKISELAANETAPVAGAKETNELLNRSLDVVKDSSNNYNGMYNKTTQYAKQSKFIADHTEGLSAAGTNMKEKHTEIFNNRRRWTEGVSALGHMGSGITAMNTTNFRSQAQASQAIASEQSGMLQQTNSGTDTVKQTAQQMLQAFHTATDQSSGNVSSMRQQAGQALGNVTAR